MNKQPIATSEKTTQQTTTPLISIDQVHRALGMEKYDPILAEVWEIKAQINKAANYDVNQISKVLNLTVQA